MIGYVWVYGYGNCQCQTKAYDLALSFLRGSNFHRGHFEKIPMKTFTDAKKHYFKKNYQEALKCTNDFISEHLESNPYPLSHEKGSPPKLYHDAYHLKGLCLIGLEMWDDALTAIRYARDAADLIYPEIGRH